MILVFATLINFKSEEDIEPTSISLQLLLYVN